MKMNTKLLRQSGLSAALALGVVAGTPGVAQAADYNRADNRFTEYADVIDVRPVYRQIKTRQPREECYVEEQQVLINEGRTTRYAESGRRDNGAGSAIVGGVIGGVIGNQIGRKGSRGTRAGATIAGAIIGSAIGGERSGSTRRHRRSERQDVRVVESQPQPVYETRPVERCQRVTETVTEDRLQYYDVTYRYKGRTFTTRSKRDPGRQIELQVSVRPARS